MWSHIVFPYRVGDTTKCMFPTVQQLGKEAGDTCSIPPPSPLASSTRSRFVPRVKVPEVLHKQT